MLRRTPPPALGACSAVRARTGVRAPRREPQSRALSLLACCVLASCKLSAWPPSPRAGRDLPLAAEHRQCAPCSHTRDRCGKQKARRPLGSGCPCTAPFGPVQMRRCASILKVCIQPRARQARRRQALRLPAARAQHSAVGAGRGRTGPWRARFHGTQGRLPPPGRCDSPTFPARPRRSPQAYPPGGQTPGCTPFHAVAGGAPSSRDRRRSCVGGPPSAAEVQANSTLLPEQRPNTCVMTPFSDSVCCKSVPRLDSLPGQPA